jgi:carbon starvation protein
MTGAAYVAKKLKSGFANAAVIPALLLWVTVTAGLLWFILIVQPGSIAAKPIPGWTIMVILIVLFILNFVFIYDFVKSKSYKKAG